MRNHNRFAPLLGRLLTAATFASAGFLAAGCGDQATEVDNTTTTVAGAIPTPSLPKPAVSIPDAVPTELVVTDLIDGSGPVAEAGDTVVVHYVGVLSADGREFDNSYDSGTPLEFTIGAGRAIPGFEQGLYGAQQGMRRQLDIPAALAYGDRPPDGGIIAAGDALSFVLDIVVVLPLSDAAEEPDIVVSPAANVDVLQSIDLVVGAGATPEDGQKVAINIMTYRADTGELLASDWGGPPLTFTYSANSEVFPGLLAAVKGMKVGGRRQSQVPFILMFDGQGSADFGLPASIDVVIVIDLVAVY